MPLRWACAGAACILLLFTTSAPLRAAPAEPGLSLLGSGLLTLPDTTTLDPGRFTLGLTLDNRDRDPLGLDVFDYAVAWAFGIGPRTEAFGRHVVSRVVSLPEPPVLPPPPLDLVVAPGAAVPARPYYALYAPTPYVDKHGSDRFDRFLPGDFVFGLKHRVCGPQHARPALALAVHLTAPLDQALAGLQSGAGTGGLDATARLVAEWRAGSIGLVGSAAYTRVGAPRYGDRVIVANDGTAEPTVEEQPLELPDRVEVGLGASRPLSRRLRGLVEAAATFEAGPRTPVLDRTWPLDVLAGLQVRWGASRLTLGVRYHAHAARSQRTEATPLSGAVDLSGVEAEARREWLVANGLGPAAARLEPGRQVLVVPGPAPLAPLPSGARVVPASFRVRSEHQVGFVVAWGWAF